MAGYIGTTPVPQATQHRESFTATGGQTSFATAGYTPQFIDVYLNGVKLAPADYTATNGSDVVLASGATASDILEIVAYTPFEVANQTFTGTTTAANLTVTGALDVQSTITSDGLTVDLPNTTDVNIDGTDGGGIQFKNSGAEQFRLDSASNDGALYHAPSGKNHTFKTDGASRLKIATGGDISFYEDTGTTPKFFWDASAESLGIGTSSPSTPLHVVGNNGILVDTQGNGDGQIYFGGISGSDRSYLSRSINDFAIWNVSNGIIKLATNDTERMRIDSSGSLMVGKTSLGVANLGFAARYFGSGSGGGTTIELAKDNATALYLNRTSSDGEIVTFRKDNTTAGSISVVGSRMNIGTGDVAIRFDNTNNAFIPWNVSTNSANADSIDFGDSTDRFNNLYLSGGVYLGGTGSANKLDDYEEGTWTPTISSGTFTAENAWYVKVGTLITINAKLSGFSDTSSNSGVVVGGVPFTSKASDHTAQGSLIADYLSNGPYFPYISSNATTIRFYIQSTTNYTTMVHSNLGSSGSFYFTLTYQTQ